MQTGTCIKANAIQYNIQDVKQVTLYHFLLCILAVSTTDYCPSKPFTAECRDNEVVKMEQALYGRMKLGTCFKRDLGSLGCHAGTKSIIYSC